MPHAAPRFACGLLNAKEDEELFYDKEQVIKKAKPAEQVYTHYVSLRICELTDGPYRGIGGVKLKPCDNNGDLMPPISHHDTVVHPKEHAAVILSQVDREMAQIK